MNFWKISLLLLSLGLFTQNGWTRNTENPMQEELDQLIVPIKKVNIQIAKLEKNLNDLIVNNKKNMDNTDNTVGTGITLVNNCFLKVAKNEDSKQIPTHQISLTAANLNEGEESAFASVVINQKYTIKIKKNKILKFRELWGQYISICAERSLADMKVAYFITKKDGSEGKVWENTFIANFENCLLKTSADLKNALIDDLISIRNFIGQIHDDQMDGLEAEIKQMVATFDKKFNRYKGIDIDNAEDSVRENFKKWSKNFLKMINHNPSLINTVTTPKLVDILKLIPPISEGDKEIDILMDSFLRNNFEYIFQLLDKDSVIQNNMLLILRKHLIEGNLKIEDIYSFLKNENDIFMLLEMRHTSVTSLIFSIKKDKNPEDLSAIENREMERSKTVDSLCKESRFRVALLIELLAHSKMANWASNLEDSDILHYGRWGAVADVVDRLISYREKIKKNPSVESKKVQLQNISKIIYQKLIDVDEELNIPDLMNEIDELDADANPKTKTSTKTSDIDADMGALDLFIKM